MKREKNPNQRAFKIVTKKAPVIVAKPADEELTTNIGSEENVSFAMSIALQMKDQQRKADEARKSETTIVFNATTSPAEMPGNGGSSQTTRQTTPSAPPPPGAASRTRKPPIREEFSFDSFTSTVRAVP